MKHALKLFTIHTFLTCENRQFTCNVFVRVAPPWGKKKKSKYINI